MERIWTYKVVARRPQHRVNVIDKLDGFDTRAQAEHALARMVGILQAQGDAILSQRVYRTSNA